MEARRACKGIQRDKNDMSQNPLYAPSPPSHKLLFDNTKLLPQVVASNMNNVSDNVSMVNVLERRTSPVDAEEDEIKPKDTVGVSLSFLLGSKTPKSNKVVVNTQELEGGGKIESRADGSILQTNADGSTIESYKDSKRRHETSISGDSQQRPLTLENSLSTQTDAAHFA